MDIDVEGHAVRRVRPERAQVVVRIGLESVDQHAVAADGAALHLRLTDEATAFRASGAATWWSATPLRVLPFDKWMANHTPSQRMYRAAAEVTIRFSDFDMLADWLAGLLDVEGVTVGSVDWRLTEQTHRNVLADVRREAVRDGIRRAADYASALSGQPSVVVRGIATMPAPLHGEPRLQAMSAASTEGAPVVPVVTPQEVVVEDTVQLKTTANPAAPE